MTYLRKDFIIARNEALGTNDSTTRRMQEGILAMEEEHADDLASLLEELGGWGGPSRPADSFSGGCTGLVDVCML